MVLPSITSFLSNLDKHSGISKSERFYVQITPPQILNIYSATNDLQYQCEVSEIPGIRLETADYRIYGPRKKIAIGRSYDEIFFSFYCTNDFYEKPFFDAWVDYVNPKSSGWDFNYKDIYTGTIRIYQLDQQANVIYSVNLLKAFPLQVAAMPTRWADDSFHKLGVTFVYDSYEVIDDFISIASDIQNFINNGGGTNFENLNSISNPFTG